MIARDDCLKMLPAWFQDTIEYPEISAAWSAGLEASELTIEHIKANLNIQTCDEDTLAAWEALLGLEPAPGDTLDLRRTRVLNKFKQVVPYSERRMRAALDDMFGAGGYDLTVDEANCTVDLVIKVLVPQGILQFTQLWYATAPAHLEMTVSENINGNIDGRMCFGGTMNSNTYIWLE